MDKIKIGIIGLGRLGRKHAENIHYKIQNAELRAICSTVEEEIRSVGSEMNPKYRTTDFMEIIENEDLDAVVIASSSQAHCRMVCAAAEAGRKDVYLEKPLGMSIEEIDQINAAVQANSGMRLQVGYNRRFDKSVQAAKNELRPSSSYSTRSS